MQGAGPDANVRLPPAPRRRPRWPRDRPPERPRPFPPRAGLRPAAFPLREPPPHPSAPHGSWANVACRARPSLASLQPCCGTQPLGSSHPSSPRNPSGHPNALTDLPEAARPPFRFPSWLGLLVLVALSPPCSAPRHPLFADLLPLPSSAPYTPLHWPAQPSGTLFSLVATPVWASLK